MARGSVAKQEVENRIRCEFGDDFVGSDGKALYVWGEENGERIQIKISLTCPKTNFQGTDVKPMAKSENFDWSEGVGPAEPTELTEEEKATVDMLLQKLGL